MTKKQITETYKGKRFNENDEYSVISTIAFHDNFAVLMSGAYSPIESGYDVEAVIDRETGKNLIEGRKRPAESKEDAIDVALEMMA